MTCFLDPTKRPDSRCLSLAQRTCSSERWSFSCSITQTCSSASVTTSWPRPRRWRFSCSSTQTRSFSCSSTQTRSFSCSSCPRPHRLSFSCSSTQTWSFSCSNHTRNKTETDHSCCQNPGGKRTSQRSWQGSKNFWRRLVVRNVHLTKWRFRPRLVWGQVQANYLWDTGLGGRWEGGRRHACTLLRIMFGYRKEEEALPGKTEKNEGGKNHKTTASNRTR